MTLPKKPLPSLRFVIHAHQTFRLIPHTDRKGRVTPGYWCVPGGFIRTTKQLSDFCKRRGWRHAIEGDDNTNLRRRKLSGDDELSGESLTPFTPSDNLIE